MPANRLRTAVRGHSGTSPPQPLQPPGIRRDPRVPPAALLNGRAFALSMGQEATMKRKALGDIVMEMGVIDELQLSSALAHHRQWGVPLGRALVEKRLCGQDHIIKALQRQTGLPLIDLRAVK